MKKIILLLLASLSLPACSDDDNGATARLEGHWSMTNFLAFMDTLPQLESGDIIWTIDLDGKELTVANYVEDEYPYILGSGTYDIRISGDRLIVEVGNYDAEYEYSFDGDQLVLDSNVDGLVDGPVMRFEEPTAAVAE